MDVEPARSGDVADPQALRRAFGTFATGVTVVTVGGAAPHGMTANSFTSVSLEPPLALVCVEREAVMHRSLHQSRLFGISVLASHQITIARHFADRHRPLGMAQFAVVECRPGAATGAPLIVGAVAHFECQLWRSYDGGDHTIFVGRVLSLNVTEEHPLLFAQGTFGQIHHERSGVIR